MRIRPNGIRRAPAAYGKQDSIMHFKMRKERKRAYFFALCLSALFFACKTPPVLHPKIPSEQEFGIEAAWQTVQPGIEAAPIRVPSIPLILYAVKIDLQHPSLAVTVSERELFIKKNGAYDGTLKAETVLQFAKRHDAVVAVNASFFQYKSMLFDMQRRVLGLHIANGQLLSPLHEPFAALLFTEDKRAFIVDRQRAENTAGALNGISGFRQILKDGQVLPSDIKNADSRTAVGVADDGKTLIILMIEAENTVRSQGLDYESAAEYLKRLGARDALQLDGGGSSTLIIKRGGKHRVAVPTIAFLPLRKVASCLGFRIKDENR